MLETRIRQFSYISFSNTETSLFWKKKINIRFPNYVQTPFTND